jgi:hypothetical protein
VLVLNQNSGQFNNAFIVLYDLGITMLHQWLEFKLIEHVVIFHTLIMSSIFISNNNLSIAHELKYLHGDYICNVISACVKYGSMLL